MKQRAQWIAAAAMALGSGSALADTTGAITLASEYLYRGYEQSLGMAAQGKLDWTSASNGLYVGGFITNNKALGGNEVDTYAGWKPQLTEDIQLDLGAIYYAFSENKEAGGTEEDYFEAYAGLQAWNASLRFYYTPEYLSDESQEAYYAVAEYSLAVSDKVVLKPQAGYSYGDGFEAINGIEHLYDYSLNLVCDMGNGYSASFGAYDSTLPDDDVKMVVSLTKGFEF